MLMRMLRLPRTELVLLLSALRLVVGIRIALWLFPYDRVRRFLMRERTATVSNISARKIAQIVDAAGRRVPGATCLTRALAAETLLKQRGHGADLRIGVSKGSANRLGAHAWVESGGVVVIGGEGADDLTPLRAGVQL